MTITFFWKTIKPNFSDKNQNHKIILVDDEEIISDNTKIADIVKLLDIPEISLSKESGTTNMINDPVDNIIQTFDKHPSKYSEDKRSY